MSRITNPETESSVSCGFFNSLNDRKYDALQMSRIFDGIINDGIFASIGTCFIVKADSGNIVMVGIGKAWFNHSWTENDSVLPVELEESELLLDRIDAIVIEVNHTEEVRDNFIKVVKGTPSSNPVKPIMQNSGNVYQHALCYIYRKAGKAEIVQADIENVIGTAETPFITGLLQVISLDELLGQWQNQLDQFISDEETDFEEWYAMFQSVLLEKEQAMDNWTEAEQATILEWFENIRNQLSDDQATHLQNEIDKGEIERILMMGFADGVKTFSDDGTVISSTDSAGRTLTKTFTNNFMTSTSVLTSSHGSEVGRMVKNFGADGRTINTTITII